VSILWILREIVISKSVAEEQELLNSVVCLIYINNIHAYGSGCFCSLIAGGNQVTGHGVGQQTFETTVGQLVTDVLRGLEKESEIHHHHFHLRKVFILSIYIYNYLDSFIDKPFYILKSTPKRLTNFCEQYSMIPGSILCSLFSCTVDVLPFKIC